MKFNLHLCMLILCAPWLSCWGDVNLADDKPVNLRFCATAWKKSVREPLYYQLDGEYLPLRLTTSSRSGVVEYHGPNPIVFYARNKGDYAPVAQAQIPPGVKQALLLFFSREEAPGGRRFDIKVLDDNESIFPRNSYRFINYSTDNIVGKLSDEKFILDANAAITIQPTQTQNNQLSLQLAEVDDNQATMIYSSVWPFHPNTRKLVILVPPEGSRMEKISMVVIPDYMPLETAQEKQTNQ
ncbi:hypothetical protein [Cerasicoccus frondis]|uniref:hypothetical protein n=1 Tax=Cerasicoccus frondis TaxID=490090 RepID=UPI00285295EE|nr:hypothetical protein [Cerasicoccus frondis]